ncbi:MAG: fatty acid desaturase [Vampirovibrio sp.]|nr:fatty acid desaturase [Vampirovibrio sp.]
MMNLLTDSNGIGMSSTTATYPISWVRTISIFVIHVLALTLAPFTFSWLGLGVFLFMFWMTGMGVTFAYHRMLTHKSFKANAMVRYLTTLGGLLSLQGGPISWVATHRRHHAKSDQENDPHSPKDGFWWSHVLWVLHIHPGICDETGYRKLARDMYDDAGIVFMEKYFMLFNIASALLFFGLGYVFGGPLLGLSVLIWGGFLRIVAVWHSTWFVNSATHLWGYRRYETTDTSRNNWWVALLTFGEGWHNNHHANQRTAKSGYVWYEFDPTYWFIALFAKLGWVTDVVPIPVKSPVPLVKQPKDDAPAVIPRQKPAFGS